jgi:hypothetical protein
MGFSIKPGTGASPKARRGYLVSAASRRRSRVLKAIRLVARCAAPVISPPPCCRPFDGTNPICSCFAGVAGRIAHDNYSATGCATWPDAAAVPALRQTDENRKLGTDRALHQFGSSHVRL